MSKKGKNYSVLAAIQALADRIDQLQEVVETYLQESKEAEEVEEEERETLFAWFAMPPASQVSEPLVAQQLWRDSVIDYSAVWYPDDDDYRGGYL